MAKKEEPKKLPVKKGTIETEVSKTTPSEDVINQLVEVGITPFKNPDKMTMAELEDRMKELTRQDITIECELAADIWAFSHNGHLSKTGYDFKEYFRNRIGISPTKAQGLHDMWNTFVNVGVDGVKKFPGLSWLKVKALLPGVKASKIHKRNIEEWLQYCTIGKEHSMNVQDIEKLVRELIAKKSKEDMDETPRRVSFVIPAYDLETKNHFLELAKNVLKTESEGNCWMTAAVEFSANHATATDAQIWKARGLIAMKETIERMFNGRIAVLFYPVDPTIVPEDLQGLIPFTKVFQAYASKGGDEVRELQFIIASTEAEAKQALGVKEIREHPVVIAPSYTPKPAPAFKEPEKKAKEKAKGKGKEKAKAEPKAEKQAKEAKFDKEKIAALKKMSDNEVKALMGTLVKELGIKKGDFDAKKEDLKKTGPESLSVARRIVYWLQEVKGGGK